MIRVLYLILLLLAPVAAVGLNFGTANRIMPQVGQRGTDASVILHGNNLENIEQVLFFGKGITLKSVEPVDKIYNGHQFNLMDAKPGTAVRLTFSIAKDCRLGEQFFRIRTPRTLSQMISFWVTPFPCVAEESIGHDRKDGHNGSMDNAQPVAVNTTVYGYHPAYSVMDKDFYKVEMKKGDRLTVEVWSACLGFNHYGGLTDPAITVYGPEKFKLAYADDTSLSDMDPILTMEIPKTGTYYINIHQNMEFEGSLRHYAAHISSEQRPMVTYPLGGQAGTKLNVLAIGDVKGDIRSTLTLPKKAGAFEHAHLSWYSSKAAYPNLLKVAEFPNVLEDGNPHFKPETAQVYTGTLPIAFNGQILNEGRTDWFRFTAKKGDRYRVRTYAAILGSSLDPKIWIRPAPGTESKINIKEDDSKWVARDWWGNDKVGVVRDRMDPVAEFTADADGDYLLGITDAQRMFGPDFVYRVEFQPIQDQAFIFFPKDYRESPNKHDAFVLHRGNTMEHTLSILNGYGNTYKGDMRVVARGLPDGVSFQCPILTAGEKLTQITFTATPEAKPWAGFIDLALEPTDPESTFAGSYVYNVPSTQRRGGYAVVFNRTRLCAFAVVGEAPIKIKVKKPEIGLALNTVLKLEVEIERSKGYTGPVIVSAKWLPLHVSKPGPLEIPAGSNKGFYQINASSSAKPGRYKITLTAHKLEGEQRAMGTGIEYVASPPIDLQIVQPYLDISLTRTAIERQKEGVIEAKIKHIRPLPSNATASLIRLPKGVELLNTRVIKAGETSISFPVRVTKDCLLGQYKEIGCRIVINDNGQTITQVSGNGVLRVDAERK